MLEFAIYYFRIFYPVLLCMERSCLDLTIQSSAQMWHSLILCSGNESRLQVNDLWWWWGCPVLYHHCIVGPTWSSYFFSLDFVFSVSTFCLKINVVRLSVRNFGMDQNARWQNENIVNSWKMWKHYCIDCKCCPVSLQNLFVAVLNCLQCRHFHKSWMPQLVTCKSLWLKWRPVDWKWAFSVSLAD